MRKLVREKAPPLPRSRGSYSLTLFSRRAYYEVYYLRAWHGTGYSVPKVVITVKVSLRVVKKMFFSRKDSTCFRQGFFFDTAFKSRNDTFGVQVYYAFNSEKLMIL